jgi:protein O-GlcNAc transferase
VQWRLSSATFIPRCAPGFTGATNCVGRRFRDLSCLALLLVAPTVTRAQDKGSNCAKAQSVLAAAQQAIEAKDSQAAIDQLNRVIQIAPQCADAFVLLGLTEFQNGATADAIQHYQEALQLQPHSYSAHYDLALAYLKDLQLEKARAQLEEAVKLGPNKADAIYNLGIVLQEMGQFSQALVKFRQARALDAKRPDVAFNIVRTELDLQHIAAARTEAKEAATHFGTDPQWSTAIGELFLKTGHAKDAVPYLQKGFRVRPTDVELRHSLAVAYLQAGQSEEVLLTIPDPKTSDDFYLRASAYYVSHRFPEADRESQRALDLAPDSSQILVLRTRLLQRAGHQNEALETAKKAMTLAPDWDQPYYLAGVSSYLLRLYEDAVIDVNRALQLNPKSARALFVQYVALANLGKLDEAEASLRRAISLDPTNARLYCHLGILLEREDKHEQAERFFKKAIELKPQYALSHYELGKLWAGSDRLRSATLELQVAIKYDPGFSAAYYQLGRIYMKLGEAKRSERMLSEFNRLHKEDLQDPDDDEAHEDDARKETEAQ